MSNQKKKSEKNRDLRFLWSSNAPHTNSGYAVQTRDLLYRFLKDGWQAACIGFFGGEGYFAHHNGEDLIDDRFKGLKLKVYPKMNDPYGGDALAGHSVDYKANAIFTMQDVWTLNPQFLQQLKVWIPYLPIDHEPVSPALIERLKLAYKLITFSRFGQKALEEKGFASTLIYEGTDVELFKPMDKQEARKKYGLPADKFLFGMISANKDNPPRKGYQEILEAMKLFVENHPEGGIYFHTQQVAPTGFPIKEYAAHLGIQDHVYLIDQYSASFRSDSKVIREELCTFDVNMHASMTEGFGLGIIEAQSCGVPVIVNNCMSMPELVIPGETGEICDTNYAWWRSQGGYVYTADVKSLHEKMEIWHKKLQDEKVQKKTAVACRKNVLTNFNIDTIVKEQWIPFLEDLQEELIPKK